MTTLLTGATGFVGAAVLRRLIKTGYNVRALVRPNSDRRNLSGIDCEIVTGDLAEPESLQRAAQGCEAVFHVAADYRLWVVDRAKMNRVNVQGTVDLIRAAAAAGASRIVYTSSVATLRLRDDGLPADEKCMPAYVNTGLNVAHVDDVAAGHLLAYDRGVVGESYILGGENRSLQWILETVAELTGRRPPRIRLPHWFITPIAYIVEGITRIRGAGEPMITVDAVRMARKPMYFSSEKARSALGYSPRPAVEALRDEIEWFRKHGYVVEGKKKQSSA